jgi:hypothetical protein
MIKQCSDIWSDFSRQSRLSLKGMSLTTIVLPFYAAVTSYHKLSSVNNTNVLSHIQEVRSLSGLKSDVSLKILAENQCSYMF